MSIKIGVLLLCGGCVGEAKGGKRGKEGERKRLEKENVKKCKIVVDIL